MTEFGRDHQKSPPEVILSTYSQFQLQQTILQFCDSFSIQTRNNKGCINDFPNCKAKTWSFWNKLDPFLLCLQQLLLAQFCFCLLSGVFKLTLNSLTTISTQLADTKGTEVFKGSFLEKVQRKKKDQVLIKSMISMISIYQFSYLNADTNLRSEQFFSKVVFNLKYFISTASIILENNPFMFPSSTQHLRFQTLTGYIHIHHYFWREWQTVNTASHLKATKTSGKEQSVF